MREIWAVALNTIREVTRSAGFLFFAAVLLAVAWWLPRLAGGETDLGPQALLDRLRLGASYGIGVPYVLLAGAAIVFAAGSMAREFEQLHVNLLLVKPLGRGEVLLGKVLGVGVLVAGLLLPVLVLFAIDVATITASQSLPERLRLAHDRFLVSREGEPALARAVDPVLEERLVRQLVAEGAGGQPVSEARARTLVRRRLEAWRIPPGGEGRFVFSGPPPDPDARAPAQLRFRILASPPAQEVELDIAWRWRGPSGPAERRLRVENSAREVIELPAAPFAGKRDIELTLVNREPPGTGVTLVVEPDAVELLHARGSCWGTLASVAALLVAHALLLAVLGVSAAALFTLPTAMLLSFSFLALVFASAFFQESLREFVARSQGHAVLGPFSSMLQGVLSRLLDLVPDFSRENPVLRLVEGRAISLGELGRQLGWNLIVRGGVVFLVGAGLFRRSEIRGRRS